MSGYDKNHEDRLAKLEADYADVLVRLCSQSALRCQLEIEVERVRAAHNKTIAYLLEVCNQVSKLAGRFERVYDWLGLTTQKKFDEARLGGPVFPADVAGNRIVEPDQPGASNA